jgi:hypothetical protein
MHKKIGKVQRCLHGRTVPGKGCTVSLFNSVSFFFS